MQESLIIAALCHKHATLNPSLGAFMLIQWPEATFGKRNGKYLHKHEIDQQSWNCPFFVVSFWSEILQNPGE